MQNVHFAGSIGYLDTHAEEKHLAQVPKGHMVIRMSFEVVGARFTFF